MDSIKSFEIQKIFKQGRKSFQGDLLMIYSDNNSLKVRDRRLAVVVSQKIVKKAVTRNKFKRRTRNAFKKKSEEMNFPKGDYLVVLKNKEMTYNQIELLIEKSARRLFS